MQEAMRGAREFHARPVRWESVANEPLAAIGFRDPTSGFDCAWLQSAWVFKKSHSRVVSIGFHGTDELTKR
jgi:hypothetical protein